MGLEGLEIDPRMIKSSHIQKGLRHFQENNRVTNTDIAKKLGIVQSAISQNITGINCVADKTLINMAKAIGLDELQIHELFREAERETYKYKYGEYPTNFKELLKDKYGWYSDTEIEDIEEQLDLYVALIKNKRNTK